MESRGNDSDAVFKSKSQDADNFFKTKSSDGQNWNELHKDPTATLTQVKPLSESKGAEALSVSAEKQQPEYAKNVPAGAEVVEAKHRLAADSSFGSGVTARQENTVNKLAETSGGSRESVSEVAKAFSTPRVADGAEPLQYQKHESIDNPAVLAKQPDSREVFAAQSDRTNLHSETIGNAAKIVYPSDELKPAEMSQEKHVAISDNNFSRGSVDVQQLQKNDSLGAIEKALKTESNSGGASLSSQSLPANFKQPSLLQKSISLDSSADVRHFNELPAGGQTSLPNRVENSSQLSEGQSAGASSEVGHQFSVARSLLKADSDGSARSVAGGRSTELPSADIHIPSGASGAARQDTNIADLTAKSPASAQSRAEDMLRAAITTPKVSSASSYVNEPLSAEQSVKTRVLPGQANAGGTAQL